ncbi:preprotein translocase [Candidatus Amesbacteria bacterium RIFCSPHIGHO2_02_FULL_47_9]|nr:MAG: preprotein translocase [Candidatus Amesbacteria bacterium RIFCSPHIGHO2_02_FULL_47_9]
MFNLGATELIIILALLLLFFGGKKIPEFIRGFGEAIKEYKKGAAEGETLKKKE